MRPYSVTDVVCEPPVISGTPYESVSTRGEGVVEPVAPQTWVRVASE